ncbi:mannonate dehydratase [Sulfitobacter sp. KE29]|uniref:mannonate dehydratase n=1 Tax=unclassified Sulfitobacter TaxID=196795 RepID=UPI000C38996A|nr:MULTISPECIES: mannonate dehydratase [unclassified Sulfitobacter]MBL93892.1 mannonate dehydratase [Magnetovibrio sp.]MDF3419771.1 mannonate dehydratase [Sulfitobacter sp. Ks38]MDF3427347.1 mannonate dehydratase [Sulfitobacter sp. KE29]MDF3430835.1 mannonate dehydratase [Sulfitobacter sp. S46]MDF3445607.1 mannonate dehydratase [Sulfitobacter sp. KE31]
MRETWRWFGEFDPIPLDQVAQTGAAGIVSALHAIPYGEVWTRDAISKRRNEISAAGFTWDVVESLPVHEDIKRGTGDLPGLFENYRQSLANLAAEGITTVCYNFMPILDWTRTDLTAPVARGGTCLHFSAAKMAAFEIHMLGREDAAETYHPDAVRQGRAWHDTASQEDKASLLHAIMSGLPGAYDRYDISGLREVLTTYDGLTHDDLRANLARFLAEIIPAAAELGIRMCIHPDDPPRDILGLPRIVSTQSAIDWIMNAHPEPANGLTLCSGSLGSHADNDVPRIARAFADRIHFVHLRNVAKSHDGSFSEAAHLTGDVDMVAVVDEILKAERLRNAEIPFRADHGHALLSDAETETQPGYTLIGRLRGLAELRGIITALNR